MSWSVLDSVLFLPLPLVTIYATLRLVVTRKQRHGLPLLPGPVSLPLLGNIFDIDTEEPWKSYTKLGTTYGDLVYIRMLDQDVIIVNSQSDAIQLFEKSSQIYSDRPYMVSLTTHIASGLIAISPGLPMATIGVFVDEYSIRPFELNQLSTCVHCNSAGHANWS